MEKKNSTSVACVAYNIRVCTHNIIYIYVNRTPTKSKRDVAVLHSRAYITVDGWLYCIIYLFTLNVLYLLLIILIVPISIYKAAYDIYYRNIIFKKLIPHFPLLYITAATVYLYRQRLDFVFRRIIYVYIYKCTIV